MKLKMKTKIKPQKSDLAEWLKLSKVFLKRGCSRLGIVGSGFCEFVPKDRLPIGIGAAMVSVYRDNAELLDVLVIFVEQETGKQLGVWIQTFLKAKKIDESKFLLKDPEQLMNHIFSTMHTLKISLFPPSATEVAPVEAAPVVPVVEPTVVPSPVEA